MTRHRLSLGSALILLGVVGGPLAPAAAAQQSGGGRPLVPAGSPRQPVRPANPGAARTPTQLSLPPAFYAAVGLTWTAPGRVGTTVVGQIISSSRILENTASFLNRHLVIPRAVQIVSKRCGQTNAYYSPSESNIVLCDELFAWMGKVFPAGQMRYDAFRDAILGATRFFVYHEVGHALVDLYDVPVLGRAAGEDAADAFATFLLTIQGESRIALIGADAFKHMARSRRAGEPLAFWDEHSLDEQRFFNILCYLYGSDRGRYAFLVGQQILPVARAETCPTDYETVRRSAAKILGPHLRR